MLSDGRIYQDIRIKKRTVLQSGIYDEKGNKIEDGPECEVRYMMIRDALPKDAPLYVVDIGANYGYFGIRLVEDFANVRVLAIEEAELNVISMIIRENDMEDKFEYRQLAYWLQSLDVPRYLQRPWKSVMLLLNVLHHVTCWKEVLALIPRYDYVFIQTPQPDDVETEHMDRVKEIWTALHTMGIKMNKIGHVPSHRTPGVMRPLYLVKS